MAGLEFPLQALIGLDFRRDTDALLSARAPLLSSYSRLPNGQPVEVLLNNHYAACFLSMSS